MSDQKWFYASNGQKVGPVSWDHLMAGLKTNTFSEETLVWAEHLPEWTPLGKCMEAGPQAASPAVVLPLEATPSPDQAKPSTVSKPKRRSKLLAIVLAVPLLGIVTAIVVPAIVQQHGAERQGESLNQTTTKATQDSTMEISNMIKEFINKMNKNEVTPESYMELKNRIKMKIDQSSGQQFLNYAVFLELGSASDFGLTGEVKWSLFQEAISNAEHAKELGWIRAYFFHGLWSARKMFIMAGNQDSFANAMAIYNGVDNWIKGAKQEDQPCKKLMDKIAPKWGESLDLWTQIEQTQSLAGDPKQPYGLRQAKIAEIQEMETAWMAASGMTNQHSLDHPQENSPCFAWMEEKCMAVMQSRE